MNANKRPQLVIVLASLALGVREIVSQQIQRALFDMGYFWSHNGWKGEPLYLQARSLYICSQTWNPRHIMYSNQESVVVDPQDGQTRVFDASQVSEFLEAARAGVIEKREIEGVQVVITPNTIRMDATALLKRVSQQADTIQGELWGG